MMTVEEIKERILILAEAISVYRNTTMMYEQEYINWVNELNRLKYHILILISKPLSLLRPAISSTGQQESQRLSLM